VVSGFCRGECYSQGAARIIYSVSYSSSSFPIRFSPKDRNAQINDKIPLQRDVSLMQWERKLCFDRDAMHAMTTKKLRVVYSIVVFHLDTVLLLLVADVENAQAQPARRFALAHNSCVHGRIAEIFGIDADGNTIMRKSARDLLSQNVR
jgi:hypothetical protein